MSSEKGIPSDRGFPFHRQDYRDTCGAACAQMILDHHGIYIPHSTSSSSGPAKSSKQLIEEQSALVNAGESLDDPIKDPESALWVVSPSKLVGILEKYGVAGYEALGWGATPRTAQIDDIYDFAEACRDALDGASGNLYCPPMIVVDSVKHWIILTSCVSDATGISGFYCHDPYSPDAPIPPTHFRGDSCSDYGQNGNAHITFEKLSERTDSRKIIVRWKDGTGGNGKRRTIRRGIRRIKFPGDKKMRPLHPISEEEIAAKASSAIEKHGLKTRRGWDQLLARTSIGLPLKVRHGHQNSFSDYYLVPVQDQIGETKMLVQMDAATGSYQGSLKAPSRHFLFRDDPKMRGLVDKVIATLRSKLEQKGIRDTSSWEAEFVKQVNSTRTNLMWEPCLESESLFFPFYAIQPSANSTAVYVRVDGEVFISLTLDKKM